MAPIEKNIPIPSLAKGPRDSKYPFRDMQVGDSVLVPEEAGRIARASAVQYGRRFGAKFASRSMPDGVRIWRIA